MEFTLISLLNGLSYGLLLFMLSSSPLPEIGEMDIAGGLRGEPIDVIRGPYTGFPIPADAEIVRAVQSAMRIANESGTRPTFQ